jgi:hypothetical protein
MGFLGSKYEYRAILIVFIFSLLASLFLFINIFFVQSPISKMFLILEVGVCLLWAIEIVLYRLIIGLQSYLQKQTLQTPGSDKNIDKIIAKEVKKQIPDIDKIFEHYKIFLAVTGILFAGMLTIIIFVLNSVKVKP